MRIAFIGLVIFTLSAGCTQALREPAKTQSPKSQEETRTRDYIKSLCAECELIVIAWAHTFGHWDSLDDAGNLVANGHIREFKVLFVLKGKSDPEIALPESDTRVVNGEEETKTYSTLSKPYFGERYIIFIREKGNVRAEKGFEVLEASDDNQLARHALSILTKPPMPMLTEALTDKDKAMRRAAVWLLSGYGKKAVPFLVEALRDKDFDVQCLSCDALEKITGRDFSFDYDKWKDWYKKNKDK